MLANSAGTFKVRLYGVSGDIKLVYVGTYVSELHKSQFSQFTDAVVC